MGDSCANKVRQATSAGRFYPANAADLRRMLEAMLLNVKPAGPAPKAIIAPHAGYLYSGPIAATAHAALVPDREVIRRIVLLGPSHRHRFDGVAASSATAFATPLGAVPVDMESVRRVCTMPQVQVIDDAHAREHSLEVHLPFLQFLLREFTIVPLVVGDELDDEVADVIEALWGGPETRLVISSDLSHYYDYAAAREMDAMTSCAIEQLNPEEIKDEQACGRTPVCALLRVARTRRLSVRTLDLRNSGDTAGAHDQVVGYGAFAFMAPEKPTE